MKRTDATKFRSKEQEKLKSSFLKEHLVVMNRVKKYRNRTGGGPPIQDAPEVNPDLIVWVFLSFFEISYAILIPRLLKMLKMCLGKSQKSYSHLGGKNGPLPLVQGPSPQSAQQCNPVHAFLHQIMGLARQSAFQNWTCWIDIWLGIAYYLLCFPRVLFCDTLVH